MAKRITLKPDHWSDEASGSPLRSAIEAYLGGQPMTSLQITLTRVYLRQWIAALDLRGLDDLRRDIDQVTRREALDAWLDRALNRGIDPL